MPSYTQSKQGQQHQDSQPALLCVEKVSAVLLDASVAQIHFKRKLRSDKKRMISTLHLTLLKMLKLFCCCARASLAPGIADVGELLAFSAHPWVWAKQRARDLADTFRAKSSLFCARLKKRAVTKCLERKQGWYSVGFVAGVALGQFSLKGSPFSTQETHDSWSFIWFQWKSR